MKTRHLFFLFLSVPLFFSCFDKNEQHNSFIINQFKSQLISDLEKDSVHGSISSVILRKGKIIWSGNFGFLNRETGSESDTNTVYRIGSITKTFTALLLLQLVQEKKINLNDPVDKFIPEIRQVAGYAPITIGELASHTSGIAREPYSILKDTGSVGHWEKTLISVLPQILFVSPPGSRFLYSNIGYAILGLALSRAENIPYTQLIQKRILNPLHMSNTFFFLKNDEEGHLAEGIFNNKNGKINMEIPKNERLRIGFRVPDGGLYSTVGDMAKFISCLMTKQSLLTKESYQKMLEIPLGEGGYGYGLMHSSRLERKDIIGNSGLMPGYAAAFAISLNTEYAVVIMRNYNIGQMNLMGTSMRLMKQLQR